jgi:hypothetical protein
MEAIKSIKIEPGKSLESDIVQRMGLASILRVLGVILIATASMTFLFQTWQGMTYLNRFLSFNAFSTLLLGSGMFLGVKVKDGTGARIFLYAALFCIPVIFSQLGGMMFDVFSPLPGSHPSIAGFFVWKASSVPAFVVALTVGISVSTAISGVAFRSLCRDKAASAFQTYMVLNALLLVPVRSDPGTAIIILVAAGLVMFSEYTDKLKKFIENGSSRSMLRGAFMLPVVILIGRAALLHDAGFFIAQSSLLTIGAYLFFLPLALDRALSLQYVGAFFITLAALEFMDRILPLGMSMTFIGYEFTSFLAAMGLVYILSLFARTQKRLFLGTVLVMFLLSVLDRMFTSAEAVFVIYTISGATAMVLISYHQKERGYFVLSVLTLGMALINYVGASLLIAAYANPWLSIACIGVAGIVFASIWEKHQHTLIRLWNSLRIKNVG